MLSDRFVISQKKHLDSNPQINHPEKTLTPNDRHPQEHYRRRLPLLVTAIRRTNTRILASAPPPAALSRNP